MSRLLRGARWTLGRGRRCLLGVLFMRHSDVRGEWRGRLVGDALALVHRMRGKVLF